MNRESLWRLQSGRYVAGHYSTEPNVAAVMIGGSAARGHADRFSDVEVGVFWREPPDDQQRQDIMRRIVADGKRAYAFDVTEQVWSEDYFVGRSAPHAELSGLLVEVGGYPFAHIDRIIDDVLLRADPDLPKQNLISGVLEGISVKGDDILAAWCNRCRVYPDALTYAVVLRYGQIDHFWRWRMWLERENRMMFDQQICDIKQRLLHLLLAVNRVYYFGFKWLPVLFDRLTETPRDFAHRFKQLCIMPPEQMAEALRELVEETYDLLESRVPRAPVERFRDIFRWQRPRWGEEGPPVHPPLPAEW